MVRAIRVDAPASGILDPASSLWRSAPPESLTLQPTPLAAQPSEYVQVSWRGRPHGVIQEVTAQAAHNGEALFFRLRWADDTRDDVISDIDRFTDAAAVLFPLLGDAPLTSMGSPRQPVSAWYWRPDFEAPLSVTVQGVGTAVRRQNPFLRAAAVYGDGGWTLVISGPFSLQEDYSVDLGPGKTWKVAFGIWQGSNRERAGLKAVTMEWQPLEIEA